MRPNLRIRLRENWYRDVWLAAVSVVVALSLLSAQSAITQIQQSRLAVCQAQDKRHDATLKTLDAQIQRFMQTASKAEAARITASRSFTVALINQLAPRLNCPATISPAKHPHRRNPSRRERKAPA